MIHSKVYRIQRLCKRSSWSGGSLNLFDYFITANSLLVLGTRRLPRYGPWINMSKRLSVQIQQPSCVHFDSDIMSCSTYNKNIQQSPWRKIRLKDQCRVDSESRFTIFLMRILWKIRLASCENISARLASLMSLARREKCDILWHLRVSKIARLTNKQNHNS